MTETKSEPTEPIKPEDLTNENVRFTIQILARYDKERFRLSLLSFLLNWVGVALILVYDKRQHGLWHALDRFFDGFSILIWGTLIIMARESIMNKRLKQ